MMDNGYKGINKGEENMLKIMIFMKASLIEITSLI
jgi:hypothetical protein